MSRRKTMLIVLAAVLAALIIIGAILNNQEVFTGNRIKNPDSYILDIKRMNGVDTHQLELSEGSVLDILFETDKGTLHMDISAPDGTTLYYGNGTETGRFVLNIRQSGSYTIAVKAKHGKGRIKIQAKNK